MKMGRRKKPQPQRLAKKLLRIRQYFRLSQEQMWEAVKTHDYNDRSRISKFENGKAAPTVSELDAYVKYVNAHSSHFISIDDLADDSIDLPF